MIKVRIIQALVFVIIVVSLVLFSSSDWFASFGEKIGEIIVLLIALCAILALFAIKKERKAGIFPKNVLEQFTYVNLGIKKKEKNEVAKVGEKNISNEKDNGREKS